MAKSGRSSSSREPNRAGKASKPGPDQGVAGKFTRAFPAPAGLSIIATPIGNAGDITLRALDALRRVAAVACEDTRVTMKLFALHAIATPLVAYHDHNAERVRPQLIRRLKAGEALALVSDAGTPLISDPGFDLVRLALAEDLPVHAAPGASALLAALTVAGLPTDRFFFAGFLPAKSAARKTALREVLPVPGTLVFYESPHRVHASLDDMVEVLGPDRRAALARELTKRHEEVLRGTLADLVAAIAERELKGEIVLILDRGEPVAQTGEDVEAALRHDLQDYSLKESVARVAARLSLPRREVYQLALSLERED